MLRLSHSILVLTKISFCETLFVVLFSNLNKAYSFSIVWELTEKEKNKNSIILNIIGRQNDIIHLPHGEKLPGFSIVKPFDYFLFENTHKFLNKVKEFIFRQNKDKEIILELVTRDELDKSEIEIIRKFVSSELKNKIKVRINIVDKIKKHKSGKIKQFFSEIKA